VGVALLAGCNLLLPNLDGFTSGPVGDAAIPFDGDAHPSDDGGLGDGRKEPSAERSCRGRSGPAAVALTAFCIDSTEVTRADYAVFLGSNPSSANQPAFCSWNQSFAPAADWPPPPGTEDRPVAFVNWCDAYAFCQWADKRLCGRIGGGPVAQTSLTDVTQDEWYVACSRAGSVTYPYGQAYDPSACNGPERDAGAGAAAAALPKCVGPLPSLHNLVGNVDEWEDSCTAATAGPGGADDSCSRRSGSFEDPEGASQTCAFARLGSRSMALGDIGFRCCSDLLP
jgi:formylglycine-generating enzyme required for sulfatase activity